MNEQGNKGGRRKLAKLEQKQLTSKFTDFLYNLQVANVERYNPKVWGTLMQKQINVFL